jgi:hypothetical protein
VRTQGLYINSQGWKFFFVFNFSTFLLCWLFIYYSNACNVDNKRPISLLRNVLAKVNVVQKTTFNQAMEV